MYDKLKSIREYLELSETQFARLLNISSYKYKNYENEMLEFTTELLILISLVFGVSIDFLVFDKFYLEEILCQNKLQELRQVGLTQRIDLIKKRICNSSDCKSRSINYIVVENIIKKYKETFKDNLHNLRLSRTMELSEIAKELNLSKEEYIKYEKGIHLPPIMKIIDIAELFEISIDELFEKK